MALLMFRGAFGRGADDVGVGVLSQEALRAGAGCVGVVGVVSGSTGIVSGADSNTFSPLNRGGGATSEVMVSVKMMLQEVST
jgi:hypothetical protein